MRVSAVSANCGQTVFNTRIKNTGRENFNNTARGSLSETPDEISENQVKLFDAINEWKNFCHRQIEQGKFDIIA